MKLSDFEYCGIFVFFMSFVVGVEIVIKMVIEWCWFDYL